MYYLIAVAMLLAAGIVVLGYIGRAPRETHDPSDLTER